MCPTCEESNCCCQSAQKKPKFLLRNCSEGRRRSQQPQRPQTHQSWSRMLKGRGFVLGTLLSETPVNRSTTTFLELCKLSHEKVGIDVISVATGPFLFVIVFDRGGK